MHPKHDSGANGCAVRVEAGAFNFLGGGQDILENDLQWLFVAQGFDNLPGVGRDPVQSLLPVEVLAAGEEPNFKCFKVLHEIDWVLDWLSVV